MLSTEMIDKLNELQPKNIDKNMIENSFYYSCDCTGGCTDGCYDCASGSGNQW